MGISSCCHYCKKKNTTIYTFVFWLAFSIVTSKVTPIKPALIIYRIYHHLPKYLMPAAAPSHGGAKNNQPHPRVTVLIFKRLAIVILPSTTFSMFFCGLGDSLWFGDFSLLPSPFSTVLTKSVTAFEGECSRLRVLAYWMLYQLWSCLDRKKEEQQSLMLRSKVMRFLAGFLGVAVPWYLQEVCPLTGGTGWLAGL